jgi:hypothetical protein
MIFSISFLLQDNHQHETIKPPALSLVGTFPDSSNSITKTIPSLDREFFKTHPEKPQLLRSLNSNDLESLKEIGGTGSTIDPVTGHQRISAFAREFNSSRYEVCLPLSPSLQLIFPSFSLSTLLSAHQLPRIPRAWLSQNLSNETDLRQLESR